LNDGEAHLGVTLSDVTAEKAQALKLPAVAGAIVGTVQKNSAAAKAGVEAGDVITEFDGIRVRSSAELRRLIRETPAGRTVGMKVVRDGKARVLSAKLEGPANSYSYNYNFSMPEVHVPPVHVPEINIPPMNFEGWSNDLGGHRATLGISGDNLTTQLAQFFGVKQGNGVLIFEVTTGGPADKAGLKAGDVIVQVDGKPIAGVEELRGALNENFTGDARKVRLTIVRDHREQTVNAELARNHVWEKHTSTALAPSSGAVMAQAAEQRALAEQIRAEAECQRALVRQEVMKQQENVKGEWQRQFQEQMRALKDQLKQLQNVHIAVSQGKEI
jgi:membrane-associated protease RseP (regulator of RpoE activity)